ncbi:MAG: hypothetical protein R3330_05660 [Saprospiraceae bacterium]|nr:hypothetical protein [Saprospiraceae bacterium]
MQDLPAEPPEQRDTAILFDPQDFSQMCYITSYYASPAETDSIVETRLGQATIRCIWSEKCSRLWSVHTPVRCDDVNQAPQER